MISAQEEHAERIANRSAGVNDMYDQHYGLSGHPFQLAADPAFYFESTTHRKALSYLGYGLAQGEGFIVITGEAGAGKTILAEYLMATIDPRRLAAVQIAPTRSCDVLRLAAHAFGIATDGAETAQIVAEIEGFLDQSARSGKRVLLVVDDAQNLSAAALEELRTLASFQLAGQSLLQIFLFGQPALRDLIHGEARLDQLRQRIIAAHHLGALQPEEAAPYIEHRLRLAGWTGRTRFTPDSYALLASESAGVPRRLNALVSRVLLLGAIDKLDIIDRRVIEAVIADAGTDAQSFDPAPLDMPSAPDVREDMSDLQAIRSEVDACSAILSRSAGDASDHGDLSARLLGFEQRLAVAELRLQEQDEVLRRILAKLIAWAERDNRSGPFASRAA
jgi:general secretion pathway protein A